MSDQFEWVIRWAPVGVLNSMDHKDGPYRNTHIYQLTFDLGVTINFHDLQQVNYSGIDLMDGFNRHLYLCFVVI